MTPLNLVVVFLVSGSIFLLSLIASFAVVIAKYLRVKLTRRSALGTDGSKEGDLFEYDQLGRKTGMEILGCAWFRSLEGRSSRVQTGEINKNRRIEPADQGVHRFHRPSTPLSK